MSDWSMTRNRYPTAHKAHTCTGCHHTIFPGQTYRRLEGVFDGRWTTWKDCRRCVPWHENVAGAYVRPEDVLDELLENWDDPHRGPDHDCWDGHTVTIYALELRGLRAREAVYQASMVPGVGLTDWTLVARWTPPRVRHKRGQTSAYEEVRGE